MTNKKDLRTFYRNKRIALTLEQVADLSLAMSKNFQAAISTIPSLLLSYSPLSDTNEFNVVVCEEYLRNFNSELIVAWPKIFVDNLSMEAHLVDSNKSFIKNQFNILEPVNGDVIPPSLIDMVFVPLLAVDKKGYRVGYGKGFYDRYLSQCKPSVFKIGFSFFEPVEAITDIDQFDVPLNLCISPTRIYEF